MILQKAQGKSIVLLSTSSPSQSLSFSTAIALYSIGSDGRRKPVTAYFIDGMFERVDIAQDHTNLRWRALEPGDYVITMAKANPYQCVGVAPEFYFHLGPEQMAYLGDFHLEAGRIKVLDHRDRDVRYFHTHATGGDEVSFESLAMQVSMADGGCGPGGPPIHVVSPHR